MKQRLDGIVGSVLAQHEEIGSASVERFYQKYTGRKARERFDGVCPPVLGIDEHSIKRKRTRHQRGTRFATTLCNLRTHRVFDIVEGRDPQALEPYFAALKGKENVRVICMDLIHTPKASGSKPILTLAKTLAHWDEVIVRMWRFTKNNGITEGFLRKMKLIQRWVYGFKKLPPMHQRLEEAVKTAKTPFDEGKSIDWPARLSSHCDEIETVGQSPHLTSVAEATGAGFVLNFRSMFWAKT